MKIYSCYSIKGGVGKTALAVNLAYYLREQGNRTLLMDLDPQGAAAFYYRVAPAEDFPAEDAGELGGEWIRKNIRESDYPGLDILPSNLAYRHFDVALNEMKKPRKQLRLTLAELRDLYDVVVLDAPPNITLLSENIFRASDAILVPVIPTTLSARTLMQLQEFFQAEDLNPEKLLPFFSMVQYGKRLHRDLMTELRTLFPRFLHAESPFSVDVEGMGTTRMPLLATTADRPAVRAYRALCAEAVARCESLK